MDAADLLVVLSLLVLVVYWLTERVQFTKYSDKRLTSNEKKDKKVNNNISTKEVAGAIVA